MENWNDMLSSCLLSSVARPKLRDSASRWQQTQYNHCNFLQVFSLQPTRNSNSNHTSWITRDLFIRLISFWCVCVCECVCARVSVFTSEGSRGCTRLSVTIAINSDDSELVADPRPQALQRHRNRPAAGGDESDEGIPHSFICREGEGEREGGGEFDGQADKDKRWDASFENDSLSYVRMWLKKIINCHITFEMIMMMAMCWGQWLLLLQLIKRVLP